MAKSTHSSRHPLGAALLFAVGTLIASGEAHAQFDAERLLKEVLPGVGGVSDDAADAGELACERHAEEEGLDVRRVLGVRSSGVNNLEVALSVEDRDERYEVLCIYDTGDGSVRDLEPVSGTREARGRDDRDDDIGGRLAQRAEDACEELAQDRDFEDVDFEDMRGRGRETVEVTMRARVRGDRRDITCLYDDDQRQAMFVD